MTTEQKEIQTEISASESAIPTSEKDTAWKDVIDRYFPKLIEFFYPDLYTKIDWERNYEILDQELQQIVRGAIVGKRFVDKLIKVYSRNGRANVVLLHCELQGQAQKNFEERLFEYFCLLYLRYKEPILTLAILIDDDANWRPVDYRLHVWGRPVQHFQFHTVKLLDYRGQEQRLRESTNPFAWVTLAQLNAIETQNDLQRRLKTKIQLTRMLYKCGFKKKDIRNLYHFIDWVMVLPKELKTIYNDDLRQFEEEQKVSFITSMEQAGIDKGIQIGIDRGMRIGLEQGLEKGVKKGEKKNTRMIAKKMFAKGLDLHLIQEVTGLSQEELDHLLIEH